MTKKTSINSMFDGDPARDADGPVSKKQKLPILDTSSAAQRVLVQGGCAWLEDSCSVDDVQTLRAALASKLAFRSERIVEVVKDISTIISHTRRLRAACLPMCSTEGACISDTLFQVLLTTQCLEEPLAETLLEKFVEVCNERDSCLIAEDNVEVPLHEQPLPQLLLAQLQILDNGNCSEKISNLMIEAFESLPPPMQAQICTIVGEAVPPEKVEVKETIIADVLAALHSAVAQHTELAVPVSAALKRLPLTIQQRTDAVDTMLRHLSSVPAEDVAEVTFYIMQECAPGPHALKVCKTLREVLRFGSAKDMRMPPEDQQGIATADSPEAVLVSKLRFQCKALGHISAAFQKIWERITDPPEWRVLDFWWLLIAHHANSAAHSNILKSFQSAFSRAPMPLKRIQEALKGHELSLKVLHTTLTSMATASPSSSKSSLGKLLLHALLTSPRDTSGDSLHECSALALSALQSTLASITCTDMGSTDVAISVLLECSEKSKSFFLQQQGLFVRVMARLENLQDPQIHRLANLFAKMVVHENAPEDEMIDASAFPFTWATQQHYANMLSAADTSKKCIAVIGTLNWVFELAAASPEKAETARAKLEMLVERLQKVPVLMAFLLDTFSDMLVSHVQSGRTLTSDMQENPILVQMRDYLGETLLESVLIDELKDGLPEKKSTVSVPGGPVVNVELWMSVTKTMPETCCNLLYRLLSTDASEKQYAKVLAPALKCISITDQVLSGYGFESLDCLPGLPFALFNTQFLSQPVFQKLQPAFRAAVLEGLLVLCNWLCEMTNAYGLVLENPQHQKQEVPPAIRAQVMMRVSQLGKIHMLLLSLLSSETAPVFGDEMASMSAGTTGFKASAWMSADADEDDANEDETTPAKPKVNSKAQACLKKAMRPLIPDTINLLHWIPWDNLTDSCSLGDLYMSLRLLLSDFHSKTRMTASAAKRPAAFRSTASAEADSEDVIITCAQRCLPVLRHLLQRAHSDHSKLIGDDSLENPESVWSAFGHDDEVVELQDGMPWEILVPTSAEVTDAHMACTETLVLSLKCFSALLSLPSIHRARHIQFLGELLRTYSAASAADTPANVLPLMINLSQSAWHSTLEAPKLTDLVQALKKTFDYLASLLRGQEGVLDHDLLVVRILRELCCIPDNVLVAAGVARVGILEHLPTQQRRDISQMRTRVSAAAKAILWTRWDGKVNADGEDAVLLVDTAWKQRPSQELASVISLFVSTHERPEELVSELAIHELASVKASTGESANTMCSDCPSLCTATFPTWYRALFKELVDRFSVLVQQAVASANDNGGSINTRLLTQDLQGQIDTACLCFASLAALVKQHDTNQMVLQAALRSGGKFVELFLKLKKWFKQRGNGEDIKRVVLSAQKGTRVVQTICAEAKAQRMGNVAKLVPSTKKNLEKFVHYVRVMLQESTAGRFWVGQLKHKNLRGEIVSATIDSDDEQDSADDDDHAKDADDGDQSNEEQ